MRSRWPKWSQPAVTEPWLSCDLGRDWATPSHDWAVIAVTELWLSCDLVVTELWPSLAVTEPWSLGPGAVTTVVTVSSRWPFIFSWVVIGDGNSISVYNYSKYLTSSLDWNRATDSNNKPSRRKQGENIAIRKNIRKATLNSKILKNKSKDRDSNFLVVFSSSKA